MGCIQWVGVCKRGSFVRTLASLRQYLNYSAHLGIRRGFNFDLHIGLLLVWLFSWIGMFKNLFWEIFEDMWVKMG